MTMAGKTLVCIQRVCAFVWFCYKQSILVDEKRVLFRKRGDVCMRVDLGADVRGGISQLTNQTTHTHTRVCMHTYNTHLLL